MRCGGLGGWLNGRGFVAVLATLSLGMFAARPVRADPARGPEALGNSALGWLRPELRARAATLAGVPRLDALPRYELELTLDASLSTYTLRETLALTNLDPAPQRQWVLRVAANCNTPVPRVLLDSGRCLGRACSVRAASPSSIVVTSDEPLAPGARIEIALELRGSLEHIDASRTNFLSQSLEGLGALAGAAGSASYGLLAEGEGIVSLGESYAALAPRRGADWERGEPKPIGDLGPDDLGNVHALVDLPDTLRVVHNGALLREQRDLAAHRRRLEIGAALVRDFVVVAGPALSSSQAMVGGVKVTSHYLAADRASGAHVLDVATHALAAFERRFGPYPYTRLDVVESPLVGGAGGVEFSGLVLVASLFYHPAPKLFGLDLGGQLAGMREFVTAHEVAHQWWHVLVGSDSRQSPFVDESLTQYSALVYLEERYGAERARRDGDANVKLNYQAMRLLGTPDGPVDAPADSFASTLAYGGLVYGKGPYFYREARARLGDAAFFAALRAYVNRFRFRSAPPEALLDELAAHGHALELRALAQHWLSERHGDEDLGTTPDLSALLGSSAGAGALPQGLDLGSLLSGLAGSGGLGDLLQGPPGATPGAPGAGVSSAELEALLRSLLQQSPMGAARDGVPSREPPADP